MCLYKVSQVFILSSVYWCFRFYKFMIFLIIISLNKMWPQPFIFLWESHASRSLFCCLAIVKVPSLLQFLWNFFPVLRLCNFYWSILKFTDIFICHIVCYWTHPVNSVLKVEQFYFWFFIGLLFYIFICWNALTLYINSYTRYNRVLNIVFR